MKVIKEAGTVTIKPDGTVCVEGFDYDYEFMRANDHLGLSGCQYGFNVGCAWALQQIAYAMTSEGFKKGVIG
jgi:hypothetical protein